MWDDVNVRPIRERKQISGMFPCCSTLPFVFFIFIRLLRQSVHGQKNPLLNYCLSFLSSVPSRLSAHPLLTGHIWDGEVNGKLRLYPGGMIYLSAGQVLCAYMTCDQSAHERFEAEGATVPSLLPAPEISYQLPPHTHTCTEHLLHHSLFHVGNQIMDTYRDYYG